MENYSSYVTPDDFKITYNEFSDLCKSKLKETLEEWKSIPYNEKEVAIRTWVKISPLLIKDEYVQMLYNDLLQCGWKKIELSFVHDRATYSFLIILYL